MFSQGDLLQDDIVLRDIALLQAVYVTIEVIREHLLPTDYLVVSVGGNDIALAPNLLTILSVESYVYSNSKLDRIFSNF